MICSGITTPEKQATPIIPLKKDYNYRKNSNRFIFNFIKKRNQKDEKFSSLPEYHSKEKLLFPSSIGVESSKVSTENDHL